MSSRTAKQGKTPGVIQATEESVKLHGPDRDRYDIALVTALQSDMRLPKADPNARNTGCVSKTLEEAIRGLPEARPATTSAAQGPSSCG
jgi:hypothetical protein